MKTLNLTLKKKWFDMIASGEKKEEYREIKPYWIQRLTWHEWHCYTPEDFIGVSASSKTKDSFYDTITFRNGYGKNAPTMVVEFKGIDIGEAVPEWSDNWQGDVFRIKLGKIISN